MRLRSYSMLVAFLLAGAVHAETMKGKCMVTAGAHGGKKYATLKCSKETRPGDYMIRNTVWEKDDKQTYGKIARFAGHSFTCDLTRGGTTRNSNVEATHYSLSKCH